MRVVFCWTDLSGYMAACWRALASMPGVDLLVVARASGAAEADFRADPLVRGYPTRLVSDAEYGDPDAIARVVAAHRPDAVALAGWAVKSYTRLPFHRELARCRFVMTMDTPWKGTLRQRLGRFAHASYFRRLDLVVVAGERTFQLARALGFAESRIRRGCYGLDYEAFAPIHARRAASPEGWPRRFLFVGRYVEDKGIGTMLEGYHRYRESTPEPWGLTACGRGPLQPAIRAAPGVTDLGFTQPADMPGVLLSSGAFVLVSHYEPWGVALAEAGASGLPLVSSEACSSAIDLVRSHYNGMVVPTVDAGALARALRWVHDRHDRLAEIGGRSQPFAAAFGAVVWAERWRDYLYELVEGARGA